MAEWPTGKRDQADDCDLCSVGVCAPFSWTYAEDILRHVGHLQIPVWLVQAGIQRSTPRATRVKVARTVNTQVGADYICCQGQPEK